MIVQFRDVELAYGRDWSLSGINLMVPEGDFLAIVGQNGSGKTTLLKAILGIVKPRRGAIRRADNRFGYVPQRQYVDEIYPLSCFDIALMGRYSLMGPLARPSRQDRDVTIQALDHVGMRDAADRPYSNLSGGQKQRVLIARALAAEPQVLVLDEPTNDMDIASEKATMDLIRHFHNEHGLTVVMVSHLLNVVAGYAKSIALINDGRIVTGPSQEILTGENLSSTYGIAVDTAEVGGRWLILPGGARW